MSRDDAGPDDNRAILITGGAGFIGANLADRLAGQGHRVIVYDALLRAGTERNLAWLQERHGRPHPVRQCRHPRRGRARARAVIEAKAVFHMAAQVAVTTSLVDPCDDFTINLTGTLNLLEAVRRYAPDAPIIFASTNKVYGDLADLDFPAPGRPLLAL
jgi:CDP-paratose 2-epimerase